MKKNNFIKGEGKKLSIQILVDKNSWVVLYAEKLIKLLESKLYKSELIFSSKRVKRGDILIILGWERILSKEILNFHKHNLVIHASNLPKGKGWSPLTWQILEGKDKVPVTLLEAVEKVDSGLIYFQEVMKFEGHELIGELREELGKKIIGLALKFIDKYPAVIGRKQKGKEAFYKRRIVKDSEIDIRKSIIELFNKFRVADNKRYPIFFNYKDHRYILKIYKVINKNGKEK